MRQRPQRRRLLWSGAPDDRLHAPRSVGRSMAGQRSITTSRPAAWARSARQYGVEGSGRTHALDPDELEDASKGLDAVRAELLLLDQQDPLQRVDAQELLELRVVEAAGEVGRVGVHQGGAQVALLAPLGVVVDPVGGDPVDRVADHVEELRVGDDRVHALGNPDVLREGRVVGRRLSPHRRASVEVGPVPVEAAREVPLGDEEVELLRLRHRGLGMQAEVVVEAARAALLRPDHDQVGQRAELGRSGRRVTRIAPFSPGRSRTGRSRGARA